MSQYNKYINYVITELFFVLVFILMYVIISNHKKII